MSEELRDYLTRSTLMNRLKIVNGREQLIAGVSTSQTTYVLKYQGSGIYAPNALICGAYAADFTPLNPSPTTFTYVVKNMEGKIIFDGRSQYNNVSSGPSQNLQSYVDNFDMGVCLSPTVWVYLDIVNFRTTGPYNVFPYMIGVEYLP